MVGEMLVHGISELIKCDTQNDNLKIDVLMLWPINLFLIFEQIIRPLIVNYVFQIRKLPCD